MLPLGSATRPHLCGHLFGACQFTRGYIFAFYDLPAGSPLLHLEARLLVVGFVCLAAERGNVLAALPCPRCRGALVNRQDFHAVQQTRFHVGDTDQTVQQTRTCGKFAAMNKLFTPILPFMLVAALALTGCSASSAPKTAPESGGVVEVEAPEEAPLASSFIDGVLTTPEYTIAITDYRVLQVGEAGNEYGEAPVLAIWYDTTNLGTSEREITPSEFIYTFEAFQDNDPNVVNMLNVGMHPDAATLDSQMDVIKTNGTLGNSVAFVLSDMTTPVELVAGRMGDEIGRMTFNLS